MDDLLLLPLFQSEINSLPSELNFEFWYGVPGFEVLIETDHRTGYAYLFIDNDYSKWAGMVWLYNIVEGPEKGPWDGCFDKQIRGRPCLNPEECIKKGEFILPYPEEFIVTCGESDRKVAIYIRNNLHAILWDGAHPGKCVLAAKASPVAIPFSDDATLAG